MPYREIFMFVLILLIIVLVVQNYRLVLKRDYWKSEHDRIGNLLTKFQEEALRISDQKESYEVLIEKVFDINSSFSTHSFFQRIFPLLNTFKRLPGTPEEKYAAVLKFLRDTGISNPPVEPEPTRT